MHALFVAPLPLTSYSHHLSRLSSLRPPVKPTLPAYHGAQPARMLQWLFPRKNADVAIQPPEKHAVLGTPMRPGKDGWRKGLEEATFGLGCFWGAERRFWNLNGVYSTSVGYAGGQLENPRYREVCSGRTGHAEVVNVVFDNEKVGYEQLLDLFWDIHDPTTRNRQGNDIGTQYRSVVFYHNETQKKLAEETKEHFNGLLKKAGRNAITTEIEPAGKYNFAEEYHQQYLAKNPGGYCGLAGTGVYVPRGKK